jgi:hypothetical protein
VAAYIIGEAGPHDPNRLPLATKRGNPIPNTRRKPLAPQIMEEAVRMHTDGRDGRVLRSASSEYNCMGLVFASRRAFVDIEHLRFILAEDEYRHVVDERLVQPGDAVIYRYDGKDAHVGIVWCRKPNVAEALFETRVLSQWGHDGEYFHDIDDVLPLYGAALEFWTDRPVE